MKKFFFRISLLILSLFLVQCAKRGTPTGGKKDSIAPKFVNATPENFTTNFNKKEIRIYFNEYIKLDKPQQQIIISPPMDPKPDISPLGTPNKYVRIRISDTLQKNTTYAINFGNSIVDNNEGNALPFFKYVFSTGSYIDSLSVSGQVKDAQLKEPEPYISVMLYEMDSTFTDSLVYKQQPRYITSTLDSLTTFTLSNLKKGTYQLVALKDQNNNYKYNPGKEKIGFIDHPVQIPTDSTYTITLFTEELPFEPQRPSLEGQQKILLGYKGKPDLDSISIVPISATPADFSYRITKVPDKDSLYIWYKPNIEKDSLLLKLITPAIQDTLITRITDKPLDSLNVSAEPSGNIDFDKDFVLKANTPILKYNPDFIKILDKDSTAVEFSVEEKPYDNSLHVKFNKKENENYNITLLPGAITDFFEKTNDTIKKSLKTKALADYGNVALTLQNVKSYPIIVQLTDEKSKVKSEKYSTSSNKLRFEYLNPGKYLIRIIYDSNSNGKWDTGNYLKKRKPEQIIYFPDTLEVRSNWDINQTFILK
ncbi:MAG: Ig-like domain-containing protein [Gillisia sp.]